MIPINKVMYYKPVFESLSSKLEIAKQYVTTTQSTFLERNKLDISTLIGVTVIEELAFMKYGRGNDQSRFLDILKNYSNPSPFDDSHPENSKNREYLYRAFRCRVVHDGFIDFDFLFGANISPTDWNIRNSSLINFSHSELIMDDTGVVSPRRYNTIAMSPRHIIQAAESIVQNYSLEVRRSTQDYEHENFLVPVYQCENCQRIFNIDRCVYCNSSP